MSNQRKRFPISYNAPAVLTFALICVAVQLLNILTQGASNRLAFSVYRSSLLDPMTYVRCVGHMFGHADWDHLINNMMYILILGPMLEEKYGSANMVFLMLATAIVTGVILMVFFPHIILRGASGVVFCMILLASITNAREHTIPLSFIVVAILYIGQQVWQSFQPNNISEMAHIVGGVVGSVLGFVMNRLGMTRYSRTGRV